MGLLSDIFLALEADLPALNSGRGGPLAVFPTIQGKRVDPVKLAMLEAVVTQQDPEALHSSIDAQLSRDWGEEFVYHIPESLVAVLAHLQPGDIIHCAELWATTEEWVLDGSASIAGKADVVRLVRELVQFAQRAQSENRSMYLWMSL